ncbi:hypothetical protein B0T18DRAFT_225452 [Schizothecium vesticola]|uniref:Uncharacterized protein n=1 Tax=Schizothecium vesticola TaxID=314040 RepID=A0AA40EKS7_9PEZI|nr:hypothetical protein B0T18DRAFT_225452 [Schizothecium vesticola]
MARGGRTSHLWRGKLYRHFDSRDYQGDNYLPLDPQAGQQSCQTLLTPEIVQLPMGRFDAFFPSSPVQGRTSRRGDQTERAWTFPKRGTVGWLHDGGGGFPRMFLSFFCPSTIIDRGRTALYQPAYAQSFRAKVPTYLSKVPKFQYRNSPLGPDPSTHRQTVSCANNSTHTVDDAEPPTSTHRQAGRQSGLWCLSGTNKRPAARRGCVTWVLT